MRLSFMNVGPEQTSIIDFKAFKLFVLFRLLNISSLV